MNIIKNFQPRNLFDLLENSKKAILYASPGINQNIAEKIIGAGKRLGEDRIWINTDSNPKVLRLAYGDSPMGSYQDR